MICRFRVVCQTIPRLARGSMLHLRNMLTCQGRSLNQCQAIYNVIIQPGIPAGLARSTSVRNPPRPLDITTSKRPYPIEGGPSSAPSMGTRYQDIQPKPAGLVSILNPSPPGEPPRKKRGRPTKVETEIRREAARQRGEPYPHMRRESTTTSAVSAPAGPSLAATQAARAVMTPQPPEGPKSDPSETSSGKRRRLRQARAGNEPRPPPDDPASRAFQTTPSRGYPDILSRDPEEGPSRPIFRAPRADE